MVWIALALLAFTLVIVGLTTAAGGWSLANRRMQGTFGLPLQEYLSRRAGIWVAVPYPSPVSSLGLAIDAANGVILENSDFMVFSRGFVFLIFFSFLVPIWSLSFSTEAIGGERESNGLIWLLTRPISRPAIYLAKFLAVLPWCVALNVGGFALICLAAGRPGPEAFRLFWPSVLWATLTFSALFFLFGAFLRRPAIIGLVYSFFLEVIVGNMPGTLKRLSIGFYARCMMFDEAAERGLQPENRAIYDPVSGTTAVWVLGLSTVFLVALGMLLFRRTEYVAGE
jgi:ABC-type transport system involved in multi-copper enzyme maturation permease subunit